LKTKNKVGATFKEWKVMVERETGHQVRIYQTDNNGEFTSKDFKKYLHKASIKHQLTTPYTSAENGKAERCHRTLLNRARAIMADNNFPLTL
jgi:transposase InsO family protein